MTLTSLISWLLCLLLECTSSKGLKKLKVLLLQTLFQVPNSPPLIMVLNLMFIASSLHSPSPCTLFSSHKLCWSSFKTISKQSHAFLHRNPSLQRHLSLGSKRVLPSVCFFNTGDKSDSKAISQPFLYYLVLFPTQLLSQNI